MTERSTPEIAEHLRLVLGSARKLEIVLLIEQAGEAGATTTELRGRMAVPVSANTLNSHLKPLHDAGIIRVIDTRKARGSYAQVWQLATSATWARLVQKITKFAPTPN